MDTLKLNMYVRTKRDGIGKIISLSIGEEDECCFIELSKRRTGIKEHNILKASHNIIDLIEVGDYVNGDKVIYTNDGYFEVGEENDNIGFTSDKFVKTIVTKEQFSAMEYRLGDK